MPEGVGCAVRVAWLVRRFIEGRSRAELCRVPRPTGVWVQNRAAAEVSDPRRRWCGLSLSAAAAVAGRVPGAGPSADVVPVVVDLVVVDPDGVAGERDCERFGAMSGAGTVLFAGDGEADEAFGDGAVSGSVADVASVSCSVTGAPARVDACLRTGSAVLWSGSAAPGSGVAGGSVAGRGVDSSVSSFASVSSVPSVSSTSSAGTGTGTAGVGVGVGVGVGAEALPDAGAGAGAGGGTDELAEVCAAEGSACVPESVADPLPPSASAPDSTSTPALVAVEASGAVSESASPTMSSSSSASAQASASVAVPASGSVAVVSCSPSERRSHSPVSGFCTASPSFSARVTASVSRTCH